MLDELQRLRESCELCRLLAHYAQAGAADGQVWQDRLMVLDGVDACELTRLHGELIAHELIEQNTGSTLVRGAGVVPACYRITAVGLRMLKKVDAKDEDLEEGLPVVIPIQPEVRRPPFGRGRSKKGKSAAPPDEGKQPDREAVAA